MHLGPIHIHSHQSHLTWDNSRSPLARVRSGAEVSFSCLDASNGQITTSSKGEDLSALQFDKLDQVNGPIYVESAKEGDVLEVEILDVTTADWGWTAVLQDFGLLKNEFPPTLNIWPINHEEGYATFNSSIRIPVSPFCGEMGVVRREKGGFSTIPPYRTGGNMDTRYLTRGTKLFLPVEVEGALFSLGDGHAAQGDGEVCGTAIETPIDVRVRLTIHSGSKPYVQTPHILSTAPPSKEVLELQSKGFYATTGVGPDLMEAARDALRFMIDWLETEKGLSRVDAYMLCSVVMDLKINEIVDEPNFVIGAFLPLAIFTE